MTTAASLDRVFADTVARRAAPRRLVPIAIVVVPLLLLQRAFSGDGRALPVGYAQLLALRSHFDPHFLFNTLNAIAEWCREDGRVAEQAILALSSMLRTIMTAIHTPRWPLAQELALIDALFQLYLIRDPALFVSSCAIRARIAGRATMATACA